MNERYTTDAGRARRATPAAHPGNGWLTFLFTLLLVSGVVLLSLGIWLAWTRAEYIVLGLGLLAVIVPSSAYALAAPGRAAETADYTPLLERLEENNRQLRLLNERVLISDQAKRIAFRQKDRAALREAIVEDIRQEDHDAALALVNEMTETHGYREEAEEFRQQILDARAQHREQRVNEAIQQVDEACAAHDWDRAGREVARFTRLYPDEPAIRELPQRVSAARDRHKNELERAFLAAAEREDVERAMELMKQLDRYLTAEEAAPYLETARGVVGKKRANLGVRFKMAIQDRDWIEALNVGDQIILEFPNSTFAQEVRGMRDTLRERAHAQRTAMEQTSA